MQPKTIVGASPTNEFKTKSPNKLISLKKLSNYPENNDSFFNLYLNLDKNKQYLLSSLQKQLPAVATQEKINLIVILPLLTLALFSIFFGFIFSDLFVGIGSDFFQNSIFIHPKNISLIEAEFSLLSDLGDSSLSKELVSDSVALPTSLVNICIKLLPVILSFLGAFSAIILYNLPIGLILNNYLLSVALPTIYGSKSSFKSIYGFLNGKYYFDIIYNYFFFISGFNLAYIVSKEIDRGAIELLGPYALSNYFYNTGKNLAKLDTGVITTYSLYITIALISLLLIIFSRVAIA